MLIQIVTAVHVLTAEMRKMRGIPCGINAFTARLLDAEEARILPVLSSRLLIAGEWNCGSNSRGAVQFDRVHACGHGSAGRILKLLYWPDFVGREGAGVLECSSYGIAARRAPRHLGLSVRRGDLMPTLAPWAFTDAMSRANGSMCCPTKGRGTGSKCARRPLRWSSRL